MHRKAVLISIWLALPILLFLSPSIFGWIDPSTDLKGYLHDLGLGWFALGAAGLIFRTLHLFVLRGPAWGLAWAAKILLDPFHNIAGYWRAPLALLSGQRFDPLDSAEFGQPQVGLK
jgi:hypothetical protein